MNELDRKTLLKLLYIPKFAACILLLFGTYTYAYPLIASIGWNQALLDEFFIIINSLFGIFNNILYLKIGIGILLAIGYIPSDIGAQKEPRPVIVLLLILSGLVSFYFPTHNYTLFIILTFYGFIALLLGFLSIRLNDHMEPNSDVFNNVQESFPQFEKKLENEYSVNLPMYYYIKDKHKKLVRRDGWINIINPFRACLVMGTPGSGKTYCFIKPSIEQMLHKGFCMYLYDFKYPSLTTFAYNHFLWAKKEKAYGNTNADFYVINFDQPEFSHRSNPMTAKLVKSDTDCRDVATTIMISLNPDNMKNKGEFFKLSGDNFLQSVVMFLKDFKKGRYCTFAHAVEFLGVELDELLPILMSQKNLESIVQPFADAFKEDAVDQIQGQIATAKLPLVAIAGESLWWTCTGEDFQLDVNDPLEPKVVAAGNNPLKKDTYAPLLSLYSSQIIKQINQKGKRKSSIYLDEMSTTNPTGVDNLIATGRENKVAVFIGIQNLSQLTRDYSKEQAEAIVNTIANVFSGQVQGETARFVSNFFGKNLQNRTSYSISAEGDVSKSINEQLDFIIPESKVSNLTQGFFVGRVADDFAQPIDLKLFNCKVNIDGKKIKADEEKFVDIPILTRFEKENAEFDYVEELWNEFQVKLDNKEIISMMETIMEKSDEDNIYVFNPRDFQFNVEDLSFKTRDVIKIKLNFQKELTSKSFDELKDDLLSYYMKQLLDFEFIHSCGIYNGNKKRFYVTIWMKAIIRANYYNIKKEIREEVKELVDNLINDPSTRSLFRPAYLKRRKYEEDLANCLNAQNILAENEPNEDPELDQDFYDNI